jgi:hypothetical protein
MTFVAWLQSLPIQGTTAIVATLSALVTLVVWVRARRGAVRWTAVLAGPFFVAAVVYYLPVFLDAPAPDYGSFDRSLHRHLGNGWRRRLPRGGVDMDGIEPRAAAMSDTRQQARGTHIWGEPFC